MNLKQTALKIGYAALKADIEQQIAELESQMRGHTRPVGKPQKPASNGTLTAAGRRRIAAAQRKRWRTIKAKLAPPATPVTGQTPPAAASAVKPVKTSKRGRPRKQTTRKAQSLASAPTAQQAA